MFKLSIIFNLFLSVNCSLYASYSLINPGPKYPPTSGEVWPKPQNETKADIIYTFLPSQFKITVTNQTCKTLTEAINRYSYSMKILYAITKRDATVPPGTSKQERKAICRRKRKYTSLKELRIALNSSCEDYPYLGMVESYELNISTTSFLRSSSVWGIMYGLETISQLFYISSDYCEVQIAATTIRDYPIYRHRGLMLDTSRHYISIRNILSTLDAMAMNKLNVFHWHLVDDQSFPYQSEVLPELSEYGAFFPTMVYNVNDVSNIVEYARQRGIRVIPEFDVPGHTRSWGVSHPEILTECCDYNDDVAGLGSMNPLRKGTYSIIAKLFGEAKLLFRDRFFHLGGDEVDFLCWLSNPEIRQYMEWYNLTQVQLFAIFMQQVIDILGNFTCPIVWQDVLDSAVPLPRKVTVQMWKKLWKHELPSLLLKKRRVILSSPWYLDDLDNTFEKLYIKDPISIMQRSVRERVMKYLIGGEACMWGEMVDDTNLLSRVWPRASAVAEVLWSGNAGAVTLETFRRIEEHACRMRRHGIDAEPPNGPGFCVL